MSIKLEPIPHFVMTDYVRVPIKKDGERYIVYLENNYIRRYNLSTLPDFLLSKITIANVIANEIPPDYKVSDYDIFICGKDNGDPDIGWRASESIYVIILHINDYAELLGQASDTRKESKRKSKKDIKKD